MMNWQGILDALLDLPPGRLVQAALAAIFDRSSTQASRANQRC